MNPIVKNILAVLAGILVGMIVNGAIISLCSGLVALPEGVDPNEIDTIRDNLHLYQPKHFAVPFIAHALGALFGGFITARIGASYQVALALGVGLFFLIGGVVMVMMLPETPMWFKALDLLGAYFPMAFLGAKIAGGNRALPTKARHDILD